MNTEYQLCVTSILIIEKGVKKMNKNLKIYLWGVIISIINYIICFYLSSREILFDYKNLLFVLAYSLLWSYFMAHSDSKKLVLYTCICSVILGLLVPVLAFKEEPLYLPRLMKDFLFWYSLPLLFLMASFLQYKFSYFKPILFFGSALYFLVAIIPIIAVFMYYITFSALLSVDGIMAALHTNFQESVEFLISYINAPRVFILSVILICFVYIGKKTYNVTKFYNWKDCCFRGNKTIIFFLFVFLLASNFDFYSKMYWHRTFNEAVKRENMLLNFEKESKIREKKLAKDAIKLSSTDKGVYALIIGETHSRSNMSALGYKRDTTPWLKKSVMEGKVFLLQNGFSNSAQTSPSLSYALTAKNQYNNIKPEDAYTVCEIAKASGFDVIWISNQIDNNIVGRIGHQANKQYWLNKKQNDTWLRQKNNVYDINVVECLKKLRLTSNKSLIIINLLGSHASYDCRYPEEFKKWDDNENLVNAYDNSILYNDYIMQEIQNILFRDLHADAMIYFADHGEELGIKFCHGNEFFRNNFRKYDSVKEIVKIPIYFSFSKAYSERYPGLIDIINNNQKLHFTNDMIYDTLLGIMHIDSPYYDTRYDITSANYKLRLDDLKVMHGEYGLRECI